jgi:integrase
MALKLKPPREGKSHNYTVRGTYLGISVDQSAKTSDRATAQKILNKIKSEIEVGIFARPGEKTFMDAAVAYMAHHEDQRFLQPIIDHFDETPLKAVDQSAIDAAAIALYPKSNAPTRNRQVYSPISAILKFAGVSFKIRRPKGWRGSARTYWWEPGDAFELFKAADAIDKEFGLFCRFLCYTGLRLSEACGVKIADLALDRNFAYVGKTKNGDPRAIHLPDHLVKRLREHIRDRESLSLFRFRKNGRIYALMKRVKKAAGLAHKPGTFHVFRHTYGTWATVYGKLDTEGLVNTGLWRNEESARRYKHTDTSEQARRSDVFPIEKRAKPATEKRGKSVETTSQRRKAQ